MSDLSYDAMPFRCFPASWEPEVQWLLGAIASRLSPELQSGFVLTDLKECHGDLVAYWRIEGGEPLSPELEAEIEMLIGTADCRIKALRDPHRNARGGSQ